MIVFRCPKCNAVQFFEACIKYSSEQSENNETIVNHYCPACRKSFHLNEIETNWSQYSGVKTVNVASLSENN